MTHKEQFGVWVEPSVYSGAGCTYFDLDTGKCNKDIDFYKKDPRACSVGLTFCHSWTESQACATSQYSFMRDEHDVRVFVDYSVIEKLGCHRSYNPEEFCFR
jgi:hypothetical protein